jgi:hypothetical protein
MDEVLMLGVSYIGFFFVYLILMIGKRREQIKWEDENQNQ